MDNQRLLIWATFGMLLWMTYQAWVTDHAPATNTPGPAITEQVEAPAADDGGIPALPQD